MPEGSPARAACPRGAPPRAVREAAVRRRGPPRGRALRRSTSLPVPRTRTKGMLPREGMLGLVSQLFGRVAGGYRPEPRHWQRSRKRVSGARLCGASAHNSSRPASWDGRSALAPLGRSVVGQLGQTGRLGLARPGSAAEVREGAPESLRARVLRGLVGPAVRQAASA